MGRDFPEMKIRALKPLNRGKTSNLQHRTPNAEVSEDSRCHSMFGVGCSMLDVRRASWVVSTVFQPLIGAMNIPLTPSLSPFEGERDGVRGMVHGKGRGEGPDHITQLFASSALPA